jgi:hypothetical protein
MPESRGRIGYLSGNQKMSFGNAPYYYRFTYFELYARQNRIILNLNIIYLISLHGQD